MERQDKVKYCKLCGKERKLIMSNKYDEDTGERKMKYEKCNTKDCEHGCHDMEFYYGPNVTIGTCKICGFVGIPCK